MADSKRISELTTAEATTSSDLFETSIPNSSSDTGYASRKVSMSEIASHIATDTEFESDLETEAKSLTGAINEVNSNADATASDLTTLTGRVDTAESDIDSLQKEIVYKAGIPDYTDGKGIISSATRPTSESTISYTAPSDGQIYLFANRGTESGSSIKININDYTVFSIPAYTAYAVACHTFTVSTGDKVVITTDSSSATWTVRSCVFFPFKSE